MADFDFDKPYGSTWKHKLGAVIGVSMNTLTLLSITMLFVAAISVLWGWYVVGLVSCAVLVASAIDHRADLRKVVHRQIYSRRGERIAVIYFLTLVAIAVFVNVAFILLYSLGHYQPLFGDVPIH